MLRSVIYLLAASTALAEQCDREPQQSKTSKPARATGWPSPRFSSVWLTSTRQPPAELPTALPTALPGSSPSGAAAPAGLWQPNVSENLKFQIILNSAKLYDPGQWQRQPKFAPADFNVVDLDLVDTTPAIIKQLHDQGKKVICYFSAGTSETWRPDFSAFLPTDKGSSMVGWAGETWLDIRSENVFEIMKKRIQLAATKGCDGVDPDNVDAFANQITAGGGFPVRLTQQDTITYIRRLAAEARSVGVAMGLKNAAWIIPQVIDDIQFAVNEQCATDGTGCDIYQPLLKAGKPVFHIEYVTPTVSGDQLTVKSDISQLNSLTTAEMTSVLCLKTAFGRSRTVNQDTAAKISTVIKTEELSRFVLYCDGSFVSES